MLFRFLATTAAVVLLAAPSTLAGGRNPASVGIFPVHRSGPGYLSVVSLTNINTNPAFETLVHYEYVNIVPNQVNKFLPLACIVFDRIELLTPADTFSTLTRCHNPTFGDQAGYLVVSAQDPNSFNVPWSFNNLVGSELVFNASGASYSLNMISIVSPIMPGLPTDMNGNGRLDFNTVEYEALPDKLYIDSYLAVVDSHLVLGNLTGGTNAINTVLFSVWNDNEFPLSATVQFKCWFDCPLDQVSPLFTQAFLANNTPDDPAELDLNCDGTNDFETGWAIIESIDVSEPGGTFIDSDGAMFGAITAGGGTGIPGGHNLWESIETQANGVFLEP